MTHPDQPLIEALISGHTDRHEERAILAVLADLPGPELDALLTDVDAARLFRSVDDRVVGPDHRSELRGLLLRRLPDLGVVARANLAYGLQAGRTGDADELAIRDIFLASEGEQLTRLKNQINMRTDAHDLEGLVFNDVDSADLRKEILDHVAREATAVHPDKAKVLSDIDDTVVSALHDRRFPRGVVYPGVLALFDALDRGPHDAPFSTGDLTFVTARPGDVFGLVENHTRASLRKAGVSTSSVLTGGLLALMTHDRMAGMKVENISHYHALFPEYRIVFLGDSGQGDIVVAEALRRDYSHVLDLVLIHDVVGMPDEEKERLRGLEIHVVDTWIAGATLAQARGLVSGTGVAQVGAEALRGLDAVTWASPDQERTTRALFERDLAAAAPPLPGERA